MTEYVKSALFVCSGTDTGLLKLVEDKYSGIDIRMTDIDSLMADPQSSLENIFHVVVSGSLDDVKQVLKLSIHHKFSVGIIPQPGYREVAKLYGISVNTEEALDLALQQHAAAIDIVLCNDEILLYKATFGRLPLLDTARNTKNYAGLASKISINERGKASRPLIVNTIKNGKMEFMVKVY